MVIFILNYKRNEYCCQIVIQKNKYDSTKLDLQEFLLALLNDVENYFKGVPPLSEDKAYASVLTIFNKISRDFPLISSIHNLSKRIIHNIK